MERTSTWKQATAPSATVLVSSVHCTVNHRKHACSPSGMPPTFAFSSSLSINITFSRYHMFGATVNTLNIHVRAGGSDTLLWSRQGSQGADWYQGIAYLPTCASEFVIIAEGIRGTSYTGDIALDDFRFDQCYEAPPPATCAQAVSDPNQFLCNSRHCIPTGSKCDFEPDCCDGSDEGDFICYAYQR